MLPKRRISEIREHLERAQNHVFFYDNDADGFCSFILLRRFIGRGKGVMTRSYPDIDKNYSKKVNELNGDYVFVLDKHSISEEFIENLGNIPIVWIDHHDVKGIDYSEFGNLSIYNSAKEGNKQAEPVSFIANEIVNNKDDEWIALAGCISDSYLPNFWKNVYDKYPELFSEELKSAFDVYYRTEFGKIARAINY